ncbi:GAF domain-containing protein [Azohydromonas aeria]|uniref:GAF domain-containing protein n=1 Tax=Azohydromonas aeria TaxID=2590212 RepID=UPI001E453E7F|nr:GAF domain-containing protein [Azohydromonas aeria]
MPKLPLPDCRWMRPCVQAAVSCISDARPPMPGPSLPGNETARLRALHGLGVLDTPAEDRYDALVQYTADALDMPMAAVSLVDAERQWFKARVGLEPQQTPRDISFCAHAILGHGVLVVEDALRDSRFAHNPLVAGPPHIRFYAGAPLRSADGLHLGALCVMAPRPRRLSATQLTTLRALADVAVWELVRSQWRSMSPRRAAAGCGLR